MFKVGDVIVYSTEGVCEIVEMCKKEFDGKEILYYVLKSMYYNSSTFFVPAENEKLTSKMHHVLPYEKIMQSLNDSSFDTVWDNNETARKEKFKEILYQADTYNIIRMLKSIEEEKIKIESKGKKLHKSDETAYKEAVKTIYEQLKLYKDISKEDIIDIISFNK